jgi:hypothetical protein
MVTWTSLTGALILSIGSEAGCILGQPLPCNVGDYLNDFAFYLFFIILFVTGLGGIGLVDAISSTVSSRIPFRRPARTRFFIVIVASLTLLYVVLRFEAPRLGETALLGGAGLELAFLVGLGCLSYWTLRRRAVHAGSLIYLVLMLALAGLFVGYNENALSLADLNAQNVTLVESIGKFAIPLLLFSVGYVAIMFQLPRKVERKLGIEEGELAPSFTFLMLFTALATYQISNFSYGPSLFLSEKEVPVFLGLATGGVLFTAKKVRKISRRGVLGKAAIIPFCDHCLSQLEATSSFCPNCGSPAKATLEKVFFAGDGELLKPVGKDHSKKRKLASLIAGGPVGYLAFGRATVVKPETEGQLIVTNKAAYLSGGFYPLNRTSRVKRGHYSNSIILELGSEIPLGPLFEKVPGRNTRRAEVEIRTSDPDSLCKSIYRALQEKGGALSRTDSYSI